jgi:hypothetical protein
VQSLTPVVRMAHGFLLLLECCSYLEN